MTDTNATEIAEIEQQLYQLTNKLNALKRESVPRTQVTKNYTFETQAGPTTLRDLFGDDTRLLIIHNMGQACRYCTLWGDEMNGILPHLESAMGVVLVSKDAPAVQRRFASSRGWQFRLASHGGGEYSTEQTVMAGQANMPGAVAYERDGDKIMRRHAAIFGPGDLYCGLWNLIGLAGLTEEDWTPQFRYWQRPDKLEDGGANVID